MLAEAQVAVQVEVQAEAQAEVQAEALAETQAETQAAIDKPQDCHTLGSLSDVLPALDCVYATSLHTRCSISQSNLPAVHAEVQVAAQAAAQAEVQVAVQVAVQAVRAAQAAQVVSYPQFSHETHYCKPHR